MPSPSICQPKISNRVKCQEVLIDITGDGLPDLVNKCEEATIKVKGPKDACVSSLGDVFPDINGEYSGGTLTFKAPIVELMKVGTSPKWCRNFRKIEDRSEEKDAKLKALRDEWGISVDFRQDEGGEHCLVEPQKKGALWRLMSLPVRKKGSKIEDLRNEFIGELYNHDVNGNKLGMGSTGTFALDDGSEISGIVVNIGFHNPVFDPRYAKTLPAKRVKYYVFTEYTKTYDEIGTRVNLSSFKKFSALAPDQMMRLSIEFFKGHKSIPEILEDLDSKQAE